MTDQERDELLLNVSDSVQRLEAGQNELRQDLAKLTMCVDAGFAEAKQERKGLDNRMGELAEAGREAGWPVPDEATG